MDVERISDYLFKLSLNEVMVNFELIREAAHLIKELDSKLKETKEVLGISLIEMAMAKHENYKLKNGQ